jgi:hypothetical protein
MKTKRKIKIENAAGSPGRLLPYCQLPDKTSAIFQWVHLLGIFRGVLKPFIFSEISRRTLDDVPRSPKVLRNRGITTCATLVLVDVQLDPFEK